MQPGRCSDSDHPALIEFAETSRGGSRDPLTLKGSHALLSGESYCVPKAALLAARARHCGIPARIGLAGMRNHLASPRLLALLRSEVFAMHGYTELYLQGHRHAPDGMSAARQASHGVVSVSS